MKIIERNNGNINFLKGFVLLLAIAFNIVSSTTFAEQVSPIPAYWKWGWTAANNPNQSHVYDSFEQIRDEALSRLLAPRPGFYIKWEPRESGIPDPGFYHYCNACYNYTGQWSDINGQAAIEISDITVNSQYQYFTIHSGMLNQQPMCPQGYSLRGPINYPYLERFYCVANIGTQVPGKNPKSCPSEGLIGNPINLSLRAKYQSETDYVAGPSSPLRFDRRYSSDGVVRRLPLVGKNWWHNYDKRIVLEESYQATGIYAYRADGRMLWFVLQGGNWVPDSDITDRLIQLTDTDGNTTGWEYFNAENNETEIYDEMGKLKSIITRGDQTQTLTYSTEETPDSIAKFENLLTEVADNFGQTIQFTYNANLQIATMTDSSGGTYVYGYDTSNRLISVTYPDLSSRVYHYENSACQAALTGITDERGIRYATYAYDSQCRVISSEHAGGVNRYSVTYGTNTATVLDPLNTSRTYNFTNILGVTKNTSVSQPCAPCGGNGAQARTYDANGNVSQKTDFNGIITKYQYNSRNLEISRTEAFGTVDARTITTAWHTTLTLPTEVVEPGKTTTFIYDSVGNLLTRAETDTTVTPNVSRTTTYTYNGNGQVLTIDGPRSDVNDVTTYAYDAQGNRSSVTNALNQVTQLPDYDAHGNVLTLIDPNSVRTELTYDARQRLLTRTVAATTADAATTTFTYDAVGNLTRITQADGSYLHYTYDDANRLTEIEDNLGNRIVYTLDNAGNRTAQQTFNSADVLVHTQTAVFNALSRMIESIGASSQSTAYEYDDNGNPILITDPKNSATQQSFDALNRLIEIQDPINGATDPTEYVYDDQDNLTQVTDPEGNVTTYIYNGFGEVITQTSPNTGTTTYTYDAAGNRITQTDARNVTTTYSYDALNRLTGIQYPDTGENISYSYDQTTNGNIGIGRLTQIQDQSGSTSYRYDRRGNIVLVDQTVVVNSQNVPFSTGYQYDPADNLTQITYPSGRVLDYSRNTLGQVSQVDTTYNMQSQTLANAIGYLPFGSVTSITYGNGLTRTLAHDQDYRTTDIVTPNLQDLSVDYDLNNNVTQLLNALNTSADQSFAYDALNRLTDGTGIYGEYDYGYDGVGNRLLETLTTGGAGAMEVYQYQSQNQRLAQRDSIQYQYDNVGNTVSIDSDTYTYNDAGRLETATVNSLVTTYRYNALGQRVLKTNTNETVLYLYDLNGQLLAEGDAQGAISTEYAWLDGQPLAQIDAPQNVAYYYHTDHLGTPQSMTDQLQQVVWKANYAPFGKADITVNTVTNNLRFPGQYFDSETGLHYNYFRYYDPATGRYITSDPIGLRAGLNTYEYVSSRPITKFDYYGLAEICNAGFPYSLSIPHTYLCVDKQCGGKHSGGESRSLYTPNSQIEDDSKYRDDSSCSDVPERDCDTASFNECIEKKLAPRKLNESYTFVGGCGEWAEETIMECWRSCKK